MVIYTLFSKFMEVKNKGVHRARGRERSGTWVLLHDLYFDDNFARKIKQEVLNEISLCQFQKTIRWVEITSTPAIFDMS